MSSFAHSSPAAASSSKITSFPTSTLSAKRRRRSRADSDPPYADTSARAGPSIIDDDDDDSEADASSNEEIQGPTHLADEESRPPRRPPRKRPHLLLSEDVDRFSTMSMNDVQPTSAVQGAEDLRAASTSRHLVPENDGRLATTPDPVLVAPPTTPTNPHKQANSAAIVVPLDAAIDDVAMDKGASSWELDRHRTYVAELEDDEEDQNETEEAAGSLKTASSEPQAFTQDELRQLSDLRELAKKNAPPVASEDMADDDTSVGPSFEVNRELLAKLEAHALATLIGNDMSRRRKIQPTSSPLRRSAAGSRGRSSSSSDDEGVVLSEDGEARRPNQLVLWKCPEDILAGTNTSSAPSAAAVPSVDHPSSELLFGKGSTLDVYPQTFSPSFAPGLTATMRMSSSGSRSGTVTPMSLAEEVEGKASTAGIEGSASASMDLDEQ